MKEARTWSSRRGAAETNPTRNHEVAGSMPGLAQWVKDLLRIAMSCGVVLRRILDLALLWLWRRLAATAPIRRLAWEPPHAADAALKGQKDKKKKTNPKKLNKELLYDPEFHS